MKPINCVTPIEWDASFYKQHAQTPWQTTLSELEHYFIESQWHILDLGCGDGKITAKLAEKVPDGKALGVDRSVNMIAEARRNHHDIHQLRFQVMTMKELNFNGEFNFILSSWSFHHIPQREKEEVLRKIFIALATGGNLLVVVPQNSDFNRQIAQFIKDSKWSIYFEKYRDERSFFTAQEYRDLLAKIGYENIVIEEKIAESHFEDISKMMLSIQSWLSPFRYLRERAGVSSEMQQKFLEDIAELRLKTDEAYQKNNSIVVKTPYLVIRAKKSAN